MAVGGSTAENELAQLSRWDDIAPTIAQAEYDARIDEVRRLASERGAEAVLIHAGDSMRYFSGITLGATERMVALLIHLQGPPIVICPTFELGTIRKQIRIEADFRLWEEDESPVALVARTLRDAGARSLAVDPMLPFQWGMQIRDAIKPAEILDGAPAIDGCRMHKSAGEIALLQQAMSMTLEVHRSAARILHPGIRQSEVLRFIDRAHRALGAAGSYFCAVQFGRATAYPHGLPGDNVLEEGDLVLIDTGCRVEGYHSDITRTYAFGQVSDHEREIWALEKEAQQAAFDAAKLGITCEAVDNAARGTIERAGLGPDYALPGLPHRTGHGIGLSIHEPAYLVRGDKTELVPGMCFSNEPMIVVPDRFGIRLEDHFYMTPDGPAWFTQPQPDIDRPFG